MADPTISRAIAKLNAGVVAMMDGIERDLIRPMQRAAFKCSYDCTDVPTYTAQEARRCVESCNGNMDQVNNHIQSQMQTFQQRWQQCMQQCQLKAQDNQQDGMDVGKVKAEGSTCMLSCVDEFVAMLPKVETRIRSQIGPLVPKPDATKA